MLHEERADARFEEFDAVECECGRRIDRRLRRANTRRERLRRRTASSILASSLASIARTSAAIRAEREPRRPLKLCRFTAPVELLERSFDVVAERERDLGGTLDDSCRARIESAAYLGSAYSYVVRIGEQRVEARVADVVLVDGRPAQAGDAIAVTFDCRAARIFDA